MLAAYLGRWPSSGARAAGAIAGALVASSLAVAPVTAWAMISDIRASHGLSEREAERVGPEAYGFDTSLSDQVAALIPHDATYALVVSESVDRDRALVFRLWFLPALLPRIAADASASDWIVSWGLPPSELGLRAADVRQLVPRRRSDPPVYVAKVVR